MPADETRTAEMWKRTRSWPDRCWDRPVTILTFARLFLTQSTLHEPRTKTNQNQINRRKAAPHVGQERGPVGCVLGSEGWKRVH